MLTTAREEGSIPWEWVVDGTRTVETPYSAWSDPSRFMDCVKQSYRRQHWDLQPIHLEVWSEKSTIHGSIAPVLDAYGLPFRSLHGYSSATMLNTIARELAVSVKPWVALYIGDWDPSGLSMSLQDIPRRLNAYGSEAGQSVRLDRIALTTEDIEDHDLAWFPTDTKRQDTRYSWYRQHMQRMIGLDGDRCWEVDALSPAVLRDRLRAAITVEIEATQWERSVLAEAAEQHTLRTYYSGYERICRQASKYQEGPP